MEVVDLNQKISYITSKINCNDIIKDLIYKQQAEIVSLKEELAMSKSTSSQLKTRLKNQVEELKFIKRQSMQITSDMAKEVESQISNLQHQLVEANKTIENQQNIINSTKQERENYENTKSELNKIQVKLNEEISNNKKNDEILKVGVEALFSIIKDLEKSNDDALVFYNEAGEEIIALKEQLKTERNDCNLMANEMGQQIINLTQQNFEYKKEIDRLNNIIIKNNKTMTSYCQSTLTKLYDCINIVHSDLRNLKNESNIDKQYLIDEMSNKINEVVDILKEHKVIVNDDFLDNFNVLSNQIMNTTIQKTIDDYNDEIYEIYGNDNPYSEKLQTMKKMYKDSLNTINELGNELVESKNKNNSDDEKIKALSDIIVKLMETIVELEDDKKTLQKNIDEYLTVINDCGEDIRKLHFTERDLITAISESGHEICVLKQKIQNMISYQEKYMSMDGEVLMNKVATLTSRNQELEKELTLLKKFDINKSLKKSLEEGQLQSAFYEIKKLRNHAEKLTQNSKQLEKDLANARSEISSIILTRDEAIINQEEAIENLDALQRAYAKQIHRLRNEIFRIYSARPSEANNRILNIVNEMLMIPSLNSIQYENNLRNARIEAVENKLHEAEEVIDSLTRENFEYQKKLNKLNNINEKLVAKLLVQNKRNQEFNLNLSQSSTDSFNNYMVTRHSQEYNLPNNSQNYYNNRNSAYISPSVTPIPPPHGTPQTLLPTHTNSPPSTSLYNNTNVNSSFINKTSIPTSSFSIAATSTPSTSVLTPPPPPPAHMMKKSPPHLLKVRRSIENLNKRGVKRATSQLCLQSSIKSPDSNLSNTPSFPKYISGVPDNNDNFSIKESKEEYNKLLNHFGVSI